MSVYRRQRGHLLWDRGREGRVAQRRCPSVNSRARAGSFLQAAGLLRVEPPLILYASASWWPDRSTRATLEAHAPRQRWVDEEMDGWMDTWGPPHPKCNWMQSYDSALPRKRRALGDLADYFYWLIVRRLYLLIWREHHYKECAQLNSRGLPSPVAAWTCDYKPESSRVWMMDARLFFFLFFVFLNDLSIVSSI